VASRSLGQVEAYFTVREILSEASKGADGVLWREFSGFGRFRFATLGFNQAIRAAVHLRYLLTPSNPADSTDCQLSVVRGPLQKSAKGIDHSAKRMIR